jgi:hypothetical protein
MFKKVAKRTHESSKRTMFDVAHNASKNDFLLDAPPAKHTQPSKAPVCCAISNMMWLALKVITQHCLKMQHKQQESQG